MPAAMGEVGKPLELRNPPLSDQPPRMPSTTLFASPSIRLPLPTGSSAIHRALKLCCTSSSETARTSLVNQELMIDVLLVSREEPGVVALVARYVARYADCA